MPKVDFSVPINNIRGVQLTEIQQDPDDSSKTIRHPLTLADIAIGALLQVEQGVESKEKLRRFALAEEIRDADGALELTVKQCSKIQRLVDKAQPTLVVGQAWPLLEGIPEEPEPPPVPPPPKAAAEPAEQLAEE